MVLKRFIFTLLLLWKLQAATSQSLYFPPLTGNNWDTLSASSLGWCTDKIGELYQYLDQKNTKAFIVLKGGKIVLEKYFGTFTQDSIWYWASAGKSLTSVACGIAIQEGYFKMTDSSSNYLGKGWTNCPPAKEALITVGHQLSMSTGLDDGVKDNTCTLDTCLEYKADAGTRWAYHNAPYTMLDGVIEAGTGQKLNAWVNKKILTPTGMAGLYLKNGYNNVFYSKPRSAARFGLLMLNQGKWDNTPVLSDTAYFRKMTNTSQNLNKSYGLLWWLNGKSSFMVPQLQLVFPGELFTHAPSDMFSALGKNGQFINVVPSQKLVMVRMGNDPGGGDVPFQLNDSIWVRLNAVICNSGAIKTVQNAPEIRIFPNPTQGEITIQSGEVMQFVELLDASGRLVQRFSEPGLKMTLQVISGIYELKIICKNGAVVFSKLTVI